MERRRVWRVAALGVALLAGLWGRLVARVLWAIVQPDPTDDPLPARTPLHLVPLGEGVPDEIELLPALVACVRCGRPITVDDHDADDWRDDGLCLVCSSGARWTGRSGGELRER